MHRKLSTIILSVFLAVLMGCLFPVQVFADQPTYIKEVKVAYGSTIEEAKQKLEKKGYTALDGDFGKGGANAVAIGYIATEDKDEAVTDLKVMEESCGYDYVKYEAVLNQKKNEVANLYNDLKVSIEGFRSNYAAETTAAVNAYNMLNYITNDDMDDMGLGDMFISEDTTDEQFETLMLQCNTEILTTIESLLASSCASTTNWVEEASEAEEVEDVTTTEAKNAKNIYSTLENFQEEVEEYESLSVDSDSTKEEIEAFNNDETTTDNQKAAYLNIAPIYNTLKETDYLDSTLYDTLMSDSVTVKELVPLANLMDDAQVSTISYIPLYQSISYALADEDAVTTAVEETEETYSDDLKKVSAYEGVDRTIFDPEGIALTDAATRQKDSTNSVEFGFKYDKIGSERAATLCFVSGFTAIVTGAAIYLWGGMDGLAESMAKKIVSKMNPFTITDTTMAETIASVTTRFNVAAITVAAVGALVIGLYYLITEVYNAVKKKETIKHEDIPRMMVNAEDLSDGTTDYTYYYGTKTVDNELADLNSMTGTHWIALYYTKETKCGNPLTTDYIVQYGDTAITKSDNLTYRPVCMFGSTGAKNLNNNGIADGNGSVLPAEDHVYLYFTEPKETASTTSSVFSHSSSVVVVSAFGGLLVGVVITMIVSNKKIKKLQSQITTTN